MFNMMVLLLMDIAYTRGPVLGFVARDHLLTILLGVTLLTLGIVAILFEGRRRVFPLRPENFVIIATYILGLWLLYSLGTS